MDYGRLEEQSERRAERPVGQTIEDIVGKVTKFDVAEWFREYVSNNETVYQELLEVRP